MITHNEATEPVLPDKLTAPLGEPEEPDKPTAAKPATVAPPITDQTPEELGVESLGLKFKAPDANAPGYFALRKRVYNHIARIIEPIASAADMDALLDFLVQFVEVPADRAEARAIIEAKASRQQYLAMMGALIRCEGEEIFPFAPAASSDNGSEEKADSPRTKPSSSNKRSASA